MAKKKAGSLEHSEKRGLVEPSHPYISISEQCALICLNRSSYYSQPAHETPKNLKIMKLIDEEYTRHPYYGSRKMVYYLEEQGIIVNRKRVQRLMRGMGISALCPKPNLSKPIRGHKIYPYLLKDVAITAPNLQLFLHHLFLQ